MSSQQSTVVISWVNATAREDGVPLPLDQIASTNISLLNADGTSTAVATLTGDGTTTTIPAPTKAGSYTYQVQNVDVNGIVGLAAAAAPVVIVDTSPPVAPTGVTAVLEAIASLTAAKKA